MTDVVALACGGLLGVFLRHGVCVAANGLFGCQFPYGILVVNLLGGLAVGYVFELFAQGVLPETARVFFIPGLLGAFTTFSAYSLDTINLFMAGRWLVSMVNIVLNNGLALLFVVLGMKLARLAKGLG